MSNDPSMCQRCGQRTAYFDKVLLIWRCICGWRDGGRGTI